jgi:hypothetical protein
MTRLTWVLALSMVVAAVGCTTQPIYNVVGSPVATSSGKAASMQEVQSAIVRAGAALGWQITPDKPGQMTGRLALRTHQAVVDINYDSKQYSINYRDSIDLNAKDGQIHKNYNGWIQNLDKGIRSQLLLL